jgi:hypothetical protein
MTEAYSFVAALSRAAKCQTGNTVKLLVETAYGDHQTVKTKNSQIG